MQNINWSYLWSVLIIIIVLVVARIVLRLFMGKLYKHKFIREPIGKYGWGLVKDDFKVRWIGLILVCVVLAMIFYFIYMYAVQSA